MDEAPRAEAPVIEIERRHPNMRDYADLWFRPSRYFAAPLELGGHPHFFILVWCVGTASVADQLLSRGGITSWLWFWPVALGLGALAGMFAALVGGFFYALRVDWSDGKYRGEEPREVMIHQSAVSAVPLLLAYALISASGVRPDRVLQEYAEPVGLLALVVLVWSLVVSYCGVIARFSPTRWKAVLWFIVLPTSVFIAFAVLQS